MSSFLDYSHLGQKLPEAEKIVKTPFKLLSKTGPAKRLLNKDNRTADSSCYRKSLKSCCNQKAVKEICHEKK
jgi:hypothetical protein